MRSVKRESSFAWVRRGQGGRLVVGTLALAVGWLAGRHVVAPACRAFGSAVDSFLFFDPSGDRQPTVEDIAANFQTSVSDWNRYVIDHGGKLPADPYRVLLDLHALSDPRVRDASALRVIEFARPLPPKLSARLSENPHLPVFWWKHPWIAPDEDWVCYADGTWAPSTECVDASAWRAMLLKSGYPVDQWTTWKARAAWTAKDSGKGSEK